MKIMIYQLHQEEQHLVDQWEQMAWKQWLERFSISLQYIQSINCNLISTDITIKQCFHCISKSQLLLDVRIISQVRLYSSQTSNASEFSGCIVKVHFQFTIAISIAPGQPYGVILQMISSKLKLPASTLILR